MHAVIAYTYPEPVLLPVDDDDGDLLVHEDQDGGQDGGHDGHDGGPPGVAEKRVDQPLPA